MGLHIEGGELLIVSLKESARWKAGNPGPLDCLVPASPRLHLVVALLRPLVRTVTLLVCPLLAQEMET